jgi:hypothetical protein
VDFVDFAELFRRTIIVCERMLPLEKARRAGTLNAADRSRQYQPPFDEITPQRTIEHLNRMGVTVRGLQADKQRMQRALMNLKLRNAIAVAVVTAVLSRSPEIARWIWTFVR